MVAVFFVSVLHVWLLNIRGAVASMSICYQWLVVTRRCPRPCALDTYWKQETPGPSASWFSSVSLVIFLPAILLGLLSHRGIQWDVPSHHRCTAWEGSGWSIGQVPLRSTASVARWMLSLKFARWVAGCGMTFHVLWWQVRASIAKGLMIFPPVQHRNMEKNEKAAASLLSPAWYFGFVFSSLFDVRECFFNAGSFPT